MLNVAFPASPVQAHQRVTGSFWFALGLLLLIGMLPGVSRAADPAAAVRSGYSEFDPAPTGNLRVAEPTVAWRIIPEGKSKVTRVVLMLNQKSVPAKYDDDRKAVWYVPDAPLPPGKYAVHCTVTLDGEFNADRDWEFCITPQATPQVDTPSTDQTKVCDSINDVRRLLNLPPLQVDSRLCAAAAAHSNYLALNQTVGHTQQKGHPGYLADTTGDRVSAFGYAGGCYESIRQGVKAAVGAVHALFDAPYHRAPFLQPGAFEIGAGVKRDIVTLLFGSSEASGIVTYPGNEQKDVPTHWDGQETPNPLRTHGGAHGPTGYVITLFVYGQDDPRLTVHSATLTTLDGQAVPVYVNTPDNDDFLRNGMLIIPQSPLKPGTTYSVAVKAEDDIGTDRSRTWTFTTAPAATHIATAKR